MTTVDDAAHTVINERGARHLPTGLHQSVESRYPFEMPFGWFMVAWSDELAPGTVLPRYYFGRHLVLWRDEQGEVHLQDAYCPHLGAHLAYGGEVKGCNLMCPFHGWEFDADGANARIPYSDRTNAKARIRTYPVREIAEHFVMAWYHPRELEPLWELETPAECLDPAFTEWTSVHFAVDAATQELAENAVDGPHFRYVHNTEVVPVIESYDADGVVSRMRSVQQFPTPRGVVDGRIDVDNFGPGFAVTRFSGIVDTFLVGCATPVDPNRCEVRFNFKTRRLDDETATANVGRAFVDEVCNQFRDDRPIWENKAHVRRPALADTDPPFMKFRKWYAQFYADGLREDVEVWGRPAPDTEMQPGPFERAQLTASYQLRGSTGAE